MSRAQVLAKLMLGYDRRYPAVQYVEDKAVANVAFDVDSALDDGTSTLRQPILYFSSTGFGTGLAGEFGVFSADQWLARLHCHVLEGYGHLDVLVAETAREQV